MDYFSIILHQSRAHRVRYRADSQTRPSVRAKSPRLLAFLALMYEIPACTCSRVPRLGMKSIDVCRCRGMKKIPRARVTVCARQLAKCAVSLSLLIRALRRISVRYEYARDNAFFPSPLAGDRTASPYYVLSARIRGRSVQISFGVSSIHEFDY